MVEHQMYLDNQHLVKDFFRYQTQTRFISSREDIEQEMRIVLWKAVLNYDQSKGIKFNTFAMRCMKNEYINLYRRNHTDKRKANEQIISLNEEEEERTKLDLLESPISVEDQVLLNIEWPVIWNGLEEEERLLLHHLYNCTKQEEIGKALGINQHTVSRRKERVYNKIKKELA